MLHCVTAGHIGTDLVTGNFNIHDEVPPYFDNAKYTRRMWVFRFWGAFIVTLASHQPRRGLRLKMESPQLGFGIATCPKLFEGPS